MTTEKRGKKSIAQLIFFILLATIVLLASLNVAKAKGYTISGPSHPLVVENVISLESLTLEQKIAQMVIGLWTPDLVPIWKELQLGGVYLYALQTESYFKEVIAEIQEGMVIPFFVTADAEGCFSPFQNFWDFSYNSKISSVEAAFEKGSREGELMAKLGFTVNFAPVVDLKDDIWKCRSFPGNSTEISELAHSYILGLQSQGIMATAKHYPGKTLIGRDPHKSLAEATITEEDIYPFNYLIEKGEVSSIMISHIITSGNVDSHGVPSVVSEAIVKDLQKKFQGLVISDEIQMLGLKNFYEDVDEMYIAVFRSGNDLVINFDKNPYEVYRMIKVIKKAVEKGEISEAQIDSSVRKILEKKGFEVRS